MKITEVRIKPIESPDNRLMAFCSITFDDEFVVRDLKIITGSKGLFVCMPSRKLTDHCFGCGGKTNITAEWCEHCGAELEKARAFKNKTGKAKLYADVAHPINSLCREKIQNQVLPEYIAELERAKQPGYVSRYDEYYEFDSPHTSSKTIANNSAPPCLNHVLEKNSTNKNFGAGILKQE